MGRELRGEFDGSSKGDGHIGGVGYPPRMTLSARNRITGKVVEIQFGGVMAHVVVRAGKNLIESVITKRSADEMSSGSPTSKA